MKIATEIPIDAKPERIWNALLDFQAYTEWNPFLRSLKGEPEPDASVEIQMQYFGESIKKRTGVITGLIVPKYLSWTWSHSLGGWWLMAEHVFRITVSEAGITVFHQEFYYTGMGLRFHRKTIARLVRLSMEKMNDGFKERVEGITK
jgi:hypothetical protein